MLLVCAMCVCVELLHKLHVAFQVTLYGAGGSGYTGYLSKIPESQYWVPGSPTQLDYVSYPGVSAAATSTIPAVIGEAVTTGGVHITPSSSYAVFGSNNAPTWMEEQYDPSK